MTTIDVKDAMFHYVSAPHRSMDQYMTIVFDSDAAEAPSFEDVVAHLERRARRVPRLKIRICEALGQLEHPRWVNDPLPVRDHVVDHDLADGRHTLESFLAELSTVPIDATDRAWTVHVGRGAPSIEGVRGVATVVVVQISHALSDGSVGTGIARALFGPDELTENVHFADDPAVSRPRPIRDALRGLLLLPVRWLRSQKTMRRSQRGYLAAVATGEIFAPQPVQTTYLNAHPDGTRAVHILQFPKDRWTSGTATVTVTALTAVGAALREHLGMHGEKGVEHLRALVPAALDTSVEWPAINRTIPTAVALHPQLTDATERAYAVSRAMTPQRAHVNDRRHVDATRSAEGYPAALLIGFGRRTRLAAQRTGMPERTTTHTTVSSVNRTSLTLELGSNRARLFAGTASLGPGCSLSHAVYGYGDVVTVCVTACPTTVPDHAGYVETLRTAIEETCSALHDR